MAAGVLPMPLFPDNFIDDPREDKVRKFLRLFR